jgi:aminoglycoside phosphotransferase (APT) family kinase protein
MKSRTKNFLTEEQIKSLVRVNFGDNCIIGNITELKGGMFNSAYLVERVSEKDNIVLKVSLKPGTKTLTYEKNLMVTEAAVYQLIAEKTTIPTPRILAADFSKKQIPSDYFFMTALEGIAMNKVIKKIPKDNLLELKKEIAGYLAELHQIQGDYFGYFTNNEQYRYKTWKEAFVHMMNMILKDGKENGVKLPYDRYEKVLREKSNCLEDIKVPSLVDFDLWPGNVFVKQQGNEFIVEGIIDFERAFWGDPLADFGGSLMLLDHIYEEEAVWNLYKEKSDFNRELTTEDQIRAAFYRLYIFTIMTVETFRYDFLYGKLQTMYAKKYIKQSLAKLEEL